MSFSPFCIALLFRMLLFVSSFLQPLSSYLCSPYYVFPIMMWLPSYNWRSSLLPDVIAGIGVAFMLIPQALSYALLAGVPPEMGLYTAWVRARFISFFSFWCFISYRASVSFLILLFVVCFGMFRSV
jgi:hypothetical protein